MTNSKHMPVEARLANCKRWHARFRRRRLAPAWEATRDEAGIEGLHEACLVATGWRSSSSVVELYALSACANSAMQKMSSRQHSVKISLSLRGRRCSPTQNSLGDHEQDGFPIGANSTESEWARFGASSLVL